MKSFKLIGVQHNKQNLERAKEAIRQLPPNQIVGIEGDHTLEEFAQNIRKKTSNPELHEMLKHPAFFRSLHDYAISLGHTVIILEKPSSLLANNNLLDLDDFLNRDKAGELKNPQLERIALMIKTTLKSKMLSEWRSKIMLKQINKHRPDVVVVGYDHALHISKNTGEKIYPIISRIKPSKIRDSVQIAKATGWNALLQITRKVKKNIK